MKRIQDREKIENALANGLVRQEGQRAAPDQLMSYILSDRKFFSHATLESAKSEKDFLEVVLGRQIRIYKVLNVKRELLQNDMVLMRSEAEKLSKRTKFYKSLNRVLEGAGF